MITEKSDCFIFENSQQEQYWLTISQYSELPQQEKYQNL